ncbi:unnamed protein product [Cylicocyclus nassatus]|uniref:Uncharacterized protein n=1 Tax=Cylicocyclus nassatus TaxID=53992 RepID=A0AA36DL85_CYLNA|nr:unnamed protein product [Cylicocyclus nassatus]
MVRFISIHSWLTSGSMISLIALLMILPLMSNSLKCYEGIHGRELEIVEKEGIKKFMCQFDIMNPCIVDAYFQYGIHEYNSKYRSQCIVHPRISCFCTKDLCNRNYALLLEKWLSTHVENGTLHECVKKQLSEMIFDEARAADGVANDQRINGIGYKMHKRVRRDDEENQVPEEDQTQDPNLGVGSDGTNASDSSSLNPGSGQPSTTVDYEGEFGLKTKPSESSAGGSTESSTIQPTTTGSEGKTPTTLAEVIEQVAGSGESFSTSKQSPGNTPAQESATESTLKSTPESKEAQTTQTKTGSTQVDESVPVESHSTTEIPSSIVDSSEKITNAGSGESTSSEPPTKHSQSEASETTPSGSQTGSGSDEAHGALSDKQDRSTDSDNYDWRLFTILAIIAAVLIFAVIPVLLLMIVAKSANAKKRSMGGDDAPSQPSLTSCKMNSIIFMLTTLSTFANQVSPATGLLKCYKGLFGYKLEIVEVDSKKYMCSYEPRDICRTYKESRYDTTTYDTSFANQCRVIEGSPYCYCTTNLCNGNYKLLKSLWQKSDIKSKRVRRCVHTYLIMMINAFHNATHYQANIEQMTTIAFEADDYEEESTLLWDDASAESLEVTSSTSSENLVKVENKNAGDVELAKASKFEYDDELTRYNWSFFIFLALFAGVLILIIIPTLLILIMVKYKCANKKSMDDGSDDDL